MDPSLDQALASAPDALQDPRGHRDHFVALAHRILDRQDDPPATRIALLRAWVDGSVRKIPRMWEPGPDSLWAQPLSEAIDRIQAAIVALYLDLPAGDPLADTLSMVGLTLNQRSGRHHLSERFLKDRWTREGRTPGTRAQCRLFTYLAWSGRGRLVPSVGLAAGYASIGKPDDHVQISFADAVEACRFDEAYALLERMGPGHGDSTTILVYSAFLAILDAQHLGRPVDQEAVLAAAARLDAMGQADLARDVRFRLGLATGNETVIAELADAGDARFTAAWQLIATAPLEALARLGRWDGLRRGLEQRARVGLHLPADDALHGILCHATGDAEGAAVALAAAEAAARACGARMRIELLLRSAASIGILDALTAGRRIPQRRDIAPDPVHEDALFGVSAAVGTVNALVRRFAVVELPVLVCGESGTGKELVARELHRRSSRRGQPFVAVNCAAVSPGLLEAELFGHVRGAFTGAERDRPGLIRQAADGVLFLDEIGDASPAFQAALLRLLDHDEYRPVGGAQSMRASCRYVCATNVDLDRAVAEGRFRGDLLYRLRRLEIRIPPLRDRPEDILPIASHLLARIAPGRTFAPSAAMWMRSRPWPGNVRELRGLIERVAVLDPDGPLGAEALAAAGLRPPDPPPPRPAQGGAPGAEDAAPGPGATPAAAGDAAPGDAGLPARERRLARCAAFIRDRGVVSRKELCAALGIGPVTASAYLALLMDRGLVERIAPTRSTATHRFGWRQDGRPIAGGDPPWHRGNGT
jgi:DNA-binding NtrC family response regulator